MLENVYLAALFIFACRVTDVTIGTLRVIYTVNGRRFIAAALGFVEAGVFITAIAAAISTVGESYWTIFGYASGFAAGTLLGMTLERMIASGWVVARVISKTHGYDITEKLREDGFGVTLMHGSGREGSMPVLFIVAKRKRAKLLLRTVWGYDQKAFVTVDPIHQAYGGFMPSNSAMRKLRALGPTAGSMTAVPPGHGTQILPERQGPVTGQPSTAATAAEVAVA
ncbi:MAG: DUF2179 domain-containing protein [Phycisphaerae bacterium]